MHRFLRRFTCVIVVVLCLYSTSNSTSAADTTKKLTVNNYSNSTIYLLRVFTDNGTEPYHRTTVGKVETSRSFVLPGDDKTVYQGQTCVITPRDSSMPDTFRQIVDQNVEKQRITLVSDPERPLASGDTVEFYLNGPYIIESGASKTVEDLPGNVYRVFGTGDDGPQDIPVGQQDQTKNFGGSEEARNKAEATNALNSIPGERRKVTFVNNSTNIIKVSWKHDAEEHAAFEVEPGGTKKIRSPLSVEWLLRNSDGDLLRSKTILQDEILNITTTAKNAALREKFDIPLPNAHRAVRVFKQVKPGGNWQMQNNYNASGLLKALPKPPPTGPGDRFQDWYLVPVSQDKLYRFEAYGTGFQPKIAVFRTFPGNDGRWSDGFHGDNQRARIVDYRPQIRGNQWVVVSSVFPGRLNDWRQQTWIAPDGRTLIFDGDTLTLRKPPSSSENQSDGKVSLTDSATDIRLSTTVDLATTDKFNVVHQHLEANEEDIGSFNHEVDGEIIHTGDRVLVNNLSRPSENGVYVITILRDKVQPDPKTGEPPKNPYRYRSFVTRVAFFTEGRDVDQVAVSVRRGKTNANTTWIPMAVDGQHSIIGDNLVYSKSDSDASTYVIRDEQDGSPQTTLNISSTASELPKQLRWNLDDSFEWDDHIWTATDVPHYTFTYREFADPYHDERTYEELSEAVAAEGSRLTSYEPAYIYLNFDGWTGSHPRKTRASKRGDIRPFNTQVGTKDRDKQIQHLLFKTAEQFAPFDVHVTRIMGDGRFSTSAADTTVFIGDDSANKGTRYFATHKLNVDLGNKNADIAWVDNVMPSSARLGNASTWFRSETYDSLLHMEVTIAHEAGHTLGLNHVRVVRNKETYEFSDDNVPVASRENLPATMSYDSRYSRFGDISLPITQYNWDPEALNPKTKKKGMSVRNLTFPEWGSSTIKRQNSFAYLKALLGPRLQDDWCSVADPRTVSSSHRDGGRRARMRDAIHRKRIASLKEKESLETDDEIIRILRKEGEPSVQNTLRPDTYRYPRELSDGGVINGWINRLGDYDVYTITSGEYNFASSVAEFWDSGKGNSAALSTIMCSAQQGYGLDPILLVYTERDGTESHALVDYDDDSGASGDHRGSNSDAKLTLYPRPHTTYYVVVGAKDSGSTGRYTLTVN